MISNDSSKILQKQLTAKAINCFWIFVQLICIIVSDDVPKELLPENLSQATQMSFFTQLKNRNGTYFTGKSIQAGVVTTGRALLKAR